MWMIIVTLAVIAAGIVVFFNLPYSATRTKFAKSVTEQIKFTAPPAAQLRRIGLRRMIFRNCRSLSDDISNTADISALRRCPT